MQKNSCYLEARHFQKKQNRQICCKKRFIKLLKITKFGGISEKKKLPLQSS